MWSVPPFNKNFEDRRRELFYQENPEAVKRRSAALRQENEPLKPPLFEYVGDLHPTPVLFESQCINTGIRKGYTREWRTAS